MNNNLLLPKEIYSACMINRAVADFKGVCTIDIKDEENYYSCIFKSCIYDEIQTLEEFENYLIGCVRQNEY